MAKSITTTVTILGKDALSPVVASATGKSLTSLQKLQKSSSSLASSAFGVTRAATLMGSAFVAPLALAGREAVMFEDKLAKVGKVANFDLGTKELTKMGEEAKAVGYHLGVMPGLVSEAFSALKQAGTPIKDLKDMATFTGEAGVAFDLTAGQAGQAFGAIKAAMGATVAETKSTFDVINKLSNNVNASPEKLVSFLTAGGAGAANALKLKGNEVAAFGATLIQAGKSGEEAATILERVAKNIFSKKALAPTFDKAGGGFEGLLAVLNKGANLKSEKAIRAYFKNFGEYGLEVRRLADGMNGPGGLAAAFSLVAKKEDYAGQVHQEFSSYMKSTLNQLKREWVNLTTTIIEFGNAVIPVLKQTMKDLSPIIKGVGAWVKVNPELTSTLVKGTIAAAGFTYAAAGVSAVIGAGAKAVAAYATVVGWFSAGGSLASVTAGVLAFGKATAAFIATSSAAPVLVFAAAIGVIGYAAYKAYGYFDGFHKMVVSLTTAFQSLADHAGPFMAKLFSGDFKGAFGELKAANAQTQLNVAAEMSNFSKTKNPYLGPTRKAYDIKNTEIQREKEGKAQWFQNMEYNRKLKKDAEMRKLLNPMNRAGKPYYEPNAEKLKPKAINYVSPEEANRAKPQPNYGGQGTSISVHNNPIFQVTGDLTSESKKALTDISNNSNYDLMKMLEKSQRRNEAKQFD